MARLRAHHRRAAGALDPAPVRVGDVVVDLATHTVGPGDLRLTPTEWRLLEALLRSPGRLLSHRRLVDEVWGEGSGTTAGNLRVYMAQLRRKLEPDPHRPRHLLNEPGLGYRFAP